MAKTKARHDAFGPWNPGLQSSIPRDVLPLSTMFRESNVETGFDTAHELADFTGLTPFDCVVFKPERLIIHELLIRVTAELSVPDGPDYEELGLNLRGMTATIRNNHILPVLKDLLVMHETLRSQANQMIAARLNEVRAPKPSTITKPKQSFWQKLFSKSHSGASANETEKAFEPTVAKKDPELHEACESALNRVVESITRHRGSLVGDDQPLIDLATGLVLNSLGSVRLGQAIEPIIIQAADSEGYRVLPAQEKPVILNVKGASAAGKSTIRPQQRKLAERLGISWEDFALISPDYWRKYLLDYRSLGGVAKYGAMLTGHELEIIDRKLDRLMSQKAQAGTMPHLLIDRFRFDSFKVGDERDQDSKLLTRFGDTVYMFFIITPPEATVDRAWSRGLSTGRFKAVDDLLDHNIEAYTGMPALFFSWALSDKRVHYEFLDNSVAKGEHPRTIAYGNNGTLTILDVSKLLDIERYKKINIEAQTPDEVYLADELLPSDNMDFLERCTSVMSAIIFADQKTGQVYGKIENDEWAMRDDTYIANMPKGSDSRIALELLSSQIDNAADMSLQSDLFVDYSQSQTLGSWAKNRQ